MSPYHAALWRHHESADGTWGALVADGFASLTIELPWRENLPNVSCIPFGRYVCTWCWSPAFGRYRYLLEGVPNRSGIRIHSAPDTSALRGCIGMKNFRTVESFEKHFDYKPFVLEVTWEQPFGYDGTAWHTLVPPNLMDELDRHCESTGGVRSEALCETTNDVSPESDNS